jgi:high mobility group protein B1
MWRALKESKKASDKKVLIALELEASEDKARYNEEIKDYVAPSDDELLPSKKGSKKKKSDKDPNAPKKNKTAYIYFCSDKRADAKSELGDVKTTEVTSHLGKMWNELKEDNDRSDELEKYTKLAADDKSRYEEEIKNYVSVFGDQAVVSKKGKKSKDLNAPKRNKTAYIYFCSDKRPDAKSELGDDAKATEVTALLGKMWKELKEDDDRSDEMEKYIKMAADDKARYEDENKKKNVVDSTDDELVEEDKPETKKVETKKVDSTKVKKVKKVDETKPSKNVTGYTYFCQTNRESVKDDNPEMKATEVTKELARLWKELSDEDKKDWSDSAKEI